MKKLLSRNVLLSVGALVLAATVVMGREKPALEIAEPKARQADPVAELDLSRMDRATIATPQPEGDPFAAKSFAPAPPQPQARAPQPPPVPQAPPLPFRYLGRLVDDGKTLVFLAKMDSGAGEENLSVQAGQKLGDYKVVKVTDSEVVFTYLPLKTTQTLPL